MDKIINCKSFDEFIHTLVKNFKDKNVHINDNDSQSVVREKDINFGKIIAGDEILEKWNYFKNKINL